MHSIRGFSKGVKLIQFSDQLLSRRNTEFLNVIYLFSYRNSECDRSKVSMLFSWSGNKLPQICLKTNILYKNMILCVFHSGFQNWSHPFTQTKFVSPTLFLRDHSTWCKLLIILYTIRYQINQHSFAQHALDASLGLIFDLPLNTLPLF